MATPEACMRRAISLSKRGYPAPNPRVGCVIEREGEVVGEGWHAFAGGPHAEVAALGLAGARAQGGTAYVTLEPCNHHGRTGPCSHALVAAGVKHVVAAVNDPNPKAGGGGKALVAAGVGFESGFLAEEASATNAIWLGAMERDRPFLVVKAAVSLDGRIALPSGESRWITGPEARRAAHRLRAELGAVLVGRRTVETDDPLLTARVRGVRNMPLRVVLDPRSKLTGNERMFGPEAQTLRFTAQKARTAHDVTVRTRNGGLDLELVLQELWSRGVTGLLVEGGATTTGGFFAARLVDRVELFIAPRLLGAGPSWLADFLAPTLAAAPRFHVRRVRRVGGDVWISLERIDD